MSKIKNMMNDIDNSIKEIDVTTNKLPTVLTKQFSTNTSLVDMFNVKNIAHSPSFGGGSLAENAKKVEAAIANMTETERVWDRAHTQFTWKYVNLNNHEPMANLRQLSAEITSRRDALNDAKWGLIRSEIEYENMCEKLINADGKGLNKFEKKLLEIDIAKIEENMAHSMKYVEGAMKDVIVLNQLYNDVKAKFDGYSELDMELNEARSHLKTCIVQSIRDLRSSNHISKGEQEYIEFLGLNPSKLEHDLRAYIEFEKTQDDYSAKILYDFLEHVTELLLPTVKDKMKHFGMSAEPQLDALFDQKIGKLTSEQTPKNDNDE